MEVNKLKPRDEISLKVAIRRCARELPLCILRRAIDGFYKRRCLCVLNAGGQFKHMLRRNDLPPNPTRQGEVAPDLPAGGQLVQYDVVEPLREEDMEAEGDLDAMDREDERHTAEEENAA